MRERSGSITDLPMSPDEDRQRRFRMYFYLMLVRVASLGIFFIVPGWWKLIPAFFAVFIPYFAVVIANVSTRQVVQGIEAPNALPPGPSAAPTGAGAAGGDAAPPEATPGSPPRRGRS